MKTLKKITQMLVILAFLFNIQTINAQFLRNIGKKVQEKIEREADRRAEKRVNKKIDEGFDEIEETIDGENTKQKTEEEPTEVEENNSQVDNNEKKSRDNQSSNFPTTYDFEWKYTLQMQTKKGSMNFSYFLKPDAPYFGSRPEVEDANMAGSMFIVMDIDRNTSTIFMDMNGNKIAKTTSLSKYMDTDTDDIDNEDYSYEEIGTKEILGYQCQGFKMENDRNIVIMYVAMDAPVSFNQVYGMDSKNTPKGFNKKWLEKAENSLVMEMDFTDKKKKKNSAKMVCIALEEEQSQIHTGDYKTMSLSSLLKKK